MATMAHISTFTIGAVAGVDIPEGRAVVISTTVSGLHDDLPVVVLAPANATNIYVALMPPDNFPRPTPERMFKRPWAATAVNANPAASAGGFTNFHPTNAVEYAIDSGQYGPMYLLGPSLLLDPIIKTGFLVQLHRGGAYTIGPNAFVDSPQIRVAGATVAVDSVGRFVYSTSNVVGTVLYYENGRLTVQVR
jgi:hypothetical protein